MIYKMPEYSHHDHMYVVIYILREHIDINFRMTSIVLASDVG